MLCPKCNIDCERDESVKNYWFCGSCGWDTNQLIPTVWPKNKSDDLLLEVVQEVSEPNVSNKLYDKIKKRLKEVGLV